MSSRTAAQLQAYLTGLKHDGVPRLDTWLPAALGTRTLAGPMGDRTFEYIRAVGRYLVLAMVYRAMRPGCPLDFCVLLQGSAGTGKSLLWHALAGQQWFGADPIDQGDKDGVEALHSLWLHEISELSALHGGDRQLQARFLCASADHFRGAYDAASGFHYRHWVFVATSNSFAGTYELPGGFVFWPVPVWQPIDIKWVKANRDQLFAEAMALFRKGAPYTPTEEDQRQLFVRMRHGGVGSRFVQLDRFITMQDLVRALGLQRSPHLREVEGELDLQMVSFFGWRRGRESGGARRRGYCAPSWWTPGAMDFSRVVEAAQATQSEQPPRPSDDHAGSPQPCTHHPGPPSDHASAESCPCSQRTPTRAEPHRRTLFRRLGLHLTWESSADDAGAGWSLLLRHEGKGARS